MRRTLYYLPGCYSPDTRKENKTKRNCGKYGKENVKLCRKNNQKHNMNGVEYEIEVFIKQNTGYNRINLFSAYYSFFLPI